MMKQKVYETRIVIFLPIDERAIFKSGRTHMSQTSISPFQLNPSCKHASVFSLMLNGHFIAYLVIITAHVLTNI